MHQRSALFVLALVAACGREPARPPVAARPVALPPVAVSIAEPPRAKLDGRLIAASARALPERFVVDGALGEWGAPAADATAASRVVVGIGSARVGIAAELTGAARDGIWLKVRFPVDELEPLRGPLDENDENGEPLHCYRMPSKNPAAKQACVDEIVGREKRFKAELTPRFVHVYRIDASGVRLAVGGQLVPIPGASIATRVDAGALFLEAELPLSALPRAGHAPLVDVSVAATVDADPASVARAAEVEDKLAPPVDFEPNGELRAAVFESLSPRPVRGHYQPGDPSSIVVSGHPFKDERSEDYDESRYVETTERLFTPLRKFSDLVVGSVYPDQLGTMREGKFVSARQGSRRLRGFVERNGELHAFYYWEGAAIIEDMVHGAYDLPAAYWQVLSVQRDGKVTRLDLYQPSHFKRRPRETHAPDFSTFSIEGEADPSRDPELEGARGIHRYVWKWDDEAKIYRDSFERTKLGAAPKKEPSP